MKRNESMTVGKGKPIQSVQRALDIVDCIGGSREGLTLREISGRLDLNENTVRGLAQTLVSCGYLMRNEETGRYHLGLSFLVNGRQVYDEYVRFMRTAAYPQMMRIAEEFDLSVWLQACLFDRIYTVDIAEAPDKHYTYTPRPGSNVPHHATASGKLHIAYLPDRERNTLLQSMDYPKLTDHTITDPELFAKEIQKTRERGYSLVREETDVGMSGVGVPLLEEGHFTGTLSIVAPTPLLTPLLDGVIPRLQQAADQIVRAMQS